MKVLVWTRLREETSGGKFLALFNLFDGSMIQMGEIYVVYVLVLDLCAAQYTMFHPELISMDYVSMMSRTHKNPQYFF